LGQVLSASGRSAEAIRAFRDAVAVYENVEVKSFHTGNRGWMYGSSDCYRNLVNAVKAKGEAREAEQAARAALIFYDKLASQHNDPAIQKEIGKWYVELSKLLREQMKHQEAEESRAKALTSGKKLLEYHPASDQDRWVLTMSQRELAAAFSSDPKLLKVAEALYRQALTVLEKLAADNPAFAHCRVGAGYTTGSIGAAFMCFGPN